MPFNFIVPFVNHIVLFFLFAFNLFYSFTFLLFGRHALHVGSVERPARNHLRAPFSCRSMKTVSQVIPGVTQDFYLLIFEEKYLKKTQCVHSCQGKNQTKVGLHRPSRGFRKRTIPCDHAKEKTKPRLVCITHQEGSASTEYVKVIKGG